MTNTIARAQVVGKFYEGNCTYELYSDGDCVLRKGNEAFLQISATMLAKLTLIQKTNAAAIGMQLEQPPMPTPYVAPRALDALAADVSKEKSEQGGSDSEDAFDPLYGSQSSSNLALDQTEKPKKRSPAPEPEFVRKLINLGGSNGWECTFKKGDTVLAKHLYSSRSFGRTSHPNDEIGKNGRIA